MAEARTTDPPTSHLAAQEAESSGRAATQRADCMECVVAFPGLTAAEIAVKTGLERHVPSRRLPELRAVGSVYNGSSRICNVTGNMSMTWWRRTLKDQMELFSRESLALEKGSRE